MLDVLGALSQRPVIITLAIVGALLVTAASMLPQPKDGSTSALSRVLTRAGYGITGASIVLFIAAGFLSNQ